MTLLNYAWVLPRLELWGCAVYLIYVHADFGHETLHSPTSG